MLNEKLNLKECLDILNEMVNSYFVESDSSGEEIIYLLVDNNEKTRALLEELIGDIDATGSYLRQFADDTIDMSIIWGTVCEQHNVDIWFNGYKKEFYIKS